ncbi:MAG: DUF3280 domain-containing protein [Kiloniellales bacterium]|nr:DUF3280 domain-containing protein [Kiloniellales bacterium]
MVRSCLTGLALTLVVASGTAALAAETPKRLAVFDFELIDTSLEGEVSGPREDEQQRLALISDLLREMLADSGRYDIVDLSSAREKIEAAGYIRGCNGCDAAIARDLDAELALTGTVQKVSNLILNINLFLRDAQSAKLLRAMSVDIRGNTDKSWSRGVSYLVRNRLLRE